MANFTLTTGSDTVTGTDADDIVYARGLGDYSPGMTLSSGDILTGGAGTDVLALYGYGDFRVDQVSFTGFESITLNNFMSGWAYGYASLYLGNQSIAVTGYGSGPEEVFLGSGAVTFQGGSGSNYVFSHDATYNWNAANAIDGCALYLNHNASDSAVYDLTTNTLSHITTLWGGGLNLTVKINSAAAGGVARFEASRENAKLVTSDAALDLSHSTVVRGFTVASSNATSTNFIVNDIETAFRITGGSGTDTVTAQGFVFSADQRYVIFITTSVERIIDTSGTYTIDNTWPNIASNGGGATAAISIAENSTAVTTITATDLNVGQTLSYSIIGGADAGKFAIGYTGALSFVTAPNFELPSDADGNNVYDVIVQASDGHGGIDTQAIAVTVTDVFENSAPTITSNGGGATAAISIVENSTSVATVTATDPDVGQTQSYSIVGGADAGKFTIGATTGALSFVTAPNFKRPTDAGGNNVYDVIVQASDGHGGIDTQAIAVGVQNVAGANILGTAGNDVIDMTHTVAGQPFPTTDGDIINGGAGSDTLAGGAGADTFVFDLTALTPAQPGFGVVDHILDYNQGNSGTFNPAEGDTFDFSALLSAGSGQPVGNLVRVLENPSGTGAILQIDQDGITNGAHWTTVARLDGVHTGDGVEVIFDASQPAATLTVPGLVPTHNFNGDGKADILWQHDSGLPAIWTMDGTNITGGSALPNPGPAWHVAEAADFNGDGKSDILWQHDNGLPAIWTMDGTNITGGSALPNPGPAWHVAEAADFNGDGKSDILWQNDNGLPVIWTMDGTNITGGSALPNPGPAWHVAEAADFNGDGKSDILWQNDSGLPVIWTMDGGNITSNVALPNPGPAWHVAEAADFNGDGKSDILWQNDNGLPAIWTMDGSNITSNVALPNPGPAWHVAEAADFNGDGKSDILWQHDSGLPAMWTMDGSSITSNAVLPDPGSHWHLF